MFKSWLAIQPVISASHYGTLERTTIECSHGTHTSSFNRWMETLPKSETQMTQTKGGNHQQEYLAKFGSRPDMKAQKFKNPFIFWLPVGTCCKIWVFFFLIQKLANLDHFFHENHNFQVVIMQKIAKENTGAKK
jgi:hypothetical protein